MTMLAVLRDNKAALFLLLLILAGLLTFLAFSLVANTNIIELAWYSTMGHCVSSGGVCTGV